MSRSRHPGAHDKELTGTFVSRTSRAKHAPAFGWYFPEAEGAVGDGTTDDTTAVQAAFAACPSGGTVMIQADFLVTAPITITTPETNVRGTRSEYAPRLIGSGFTDYILKVQTYGCTFEGVFFQGDGVTGGSTFTPTVSGMLFDRSDGSGSATLANLDGIVRDCSFALMKQAISANGRNVDVLDSVFSQTVRGIQVDRYGTEECRGFRILDNRFHSVGLGSAMDLGGVESVCIEFTSNAAFGNEVCGNMADSSNRLFFRGPLDRSMVNDNHLYGQVGSGFEILAPAAGASWMAWQLCGNAFQGSYNSGWTGTDLTAAKSTPDSFLKALGTLSGGIVRGNVATRTRKHGFDIANLTNCTLAGNTVSDAGMYASIGDGYVYDAYSIAAGDGALIDGNRARNGQIGGSATHRYGINVGSSTNGKVLNNRIANSATADYNAASGTMTIRDDSPGNADLWFNATGTQQFGVRLYKKATAGAKILFGAFDVLSQSDTSGGEKANALIRVVANGVMTTVATFTWNKAMNVGSAPPSPVDSDGYVNATALHANFTTMVPRAATGVPNNSFFVDSADNLLKFRDNSGALKTVTLA